MTSHKSLKNNFGYAFHSGLSTSVMPVFELAALFLFLTALPIYTLTRVTSGDSGFVRASKNFTYLLFPESSMFSFIVIFAVVICSVLTGLATFKFATGKKMINVYYSLGIKRDKLYSAKFLAGLVRLVLAVVIPLTVTLIANTALCGMSKYLLQAYLIYIIGLVSVSLISYSITAAVCASVGTIFEGGVFSAIIILFPTLLLSCIENLTVSLLLGSPYGVSFGGDYYAGVGGVVSLSNKFRMFRPISFFQNTLIQYSSLNSDKKFTAFGFENTAWSSPNFLPSVIWLFVAAAVFFIGMYFFQKRKAEIGGFIGTNKVMNFIATFIVGFFAFSMFIKYIPVDNIYLLFLISLGAYFIVYCVLDFILIRNFKEFFRGMKKLPVHLGVTLVIGVVIATGFFGIAQKLPSVDDIEYASISSSSYNSTFALGSEISFDYLSEAYAAQAYSMGEFTQKEDIEKVLEINNELFDEGFVNQNYVTKGENEESVLKYPTFITYKLKSGKIIRKYFTNTSLDISKKILEIENTAYLKNRQQEVLIGKMTSFDMTKLKQGISTVEDTRKAAMFVSQSIVQSSSSNISLSSATLDTTTFINLTDSQRLKLRQALAKDLLTQTVEQKYFGSGDSSLGVLTFSAENTFVKNQNDINLDIKTAESLVSPEETNANNEIEYNVPASSYRKLLRDSISANKLFMSYGENTLNIDYYITTDMINTITLLKEYGVYKFLTPSIEIKEVLVYRIKDRLIMNKYALQYGTSSPSFVGYTGYYSENGYTDSPYQYKATDPTEIGKLLSASKINNFGDGSVYAITVKYKDETYLPSILYIAEKDMPSELASKIGGTVSFDGPYGSNYVYY